MTLDVFQYIDVKYEFHKIETHYVSREWITLYPENLLIPGY